MSEADRQQQRREDNDRERHDGEEQESPPSGDAQGQAAVDEVDDLLDEIDDVLEENAEEFVRGYVQKGGE